jgi:P4 family phage/plasmid primase-like protien
MMNKSPLKNTNFQEFLTAHNAKNFPGKTATHTRIPDPTMGIFGGAYVITPEELPTFYELYQEYVFHFHKMEYLTEKQLDNGPILLDFDFKYASDIDARQHTQEDVINILTQCYLEILRDLLVFGPDTNFDIYVMEKPTVNRLPDKFITKDGIHIVIGIQMDHILQCMLRKRALEQIPSILNLPLINTYDDVLDACISKKTTNWQLYGSRKPGHQAYELVQMYNVTIDPADKEFMLNEMDISEFNLSKNFKKLSAQYSGNPAFEIHPSAKAEYEKQLSATQQKYKAAGGGGGGGAKIIRKVKVEQSEAEPISLDEITNMEMLDKAIDAFLLQLSSDEYLLREMHDYTQILPSKYYASGSHAKNREVAFALKNTDDRLFLSWVKLRSKADDFNFSEIPELKTKWDKYFNKTDGICLTGKSIIFWAKQDANEEYLKIKDRTMDHHIEETINEPTDYNFAMILYQMFKDKYVCTSIGQKCWYRFTEHAWEEDKGESLRASISKELYEAYKTKRKRAQDEAASLEDGNPRKIALIYGEKGKDSIIGKLIKIMQRFKTGSDKNNIFRECAEIFYDKNFMEKMDENKYLMCFTNGVVDFKNRVFRDGLPLDYITKSTGIPFIPYSDIDFEGDTAKNIIAFMRQLFPIASLNKYMWDHLASVLIGENMNQTFNIYVGTGSNGKSMLMDLMSHALGKYKGTVPITLVSEKRTSIGGTSSEIIQLKGIRYAVMQEPSKNTKINEGVVKELTGGDPLQGRGLYKESQTFIPQFTLAACTNSLFQVDATDNGTWRRFRICRFLARFVDSLEEIDEKENSSVSEIERTYEFIKDKKLKEQLPIWAPIFASMLVNRAYETQGVVEDCDVVMMETTKYRNSQDHIATFVSENIAKCIGGRGIKKAELNEEFKLWYGEHMGGKQLPKATELHEYMDKTFGKFNVPMKVWQNVKILKYDEPDILDEI